MTAQDGHDDRLVLTTHLGDKTIKHAQVIDVRRNSEDAAKMLEEHEREWARVAARVVAPAASPALCRQPSVVM